MAAPYNPPVRGEDLVLYIALVDATDPLSFKVSPQIDTGDFKISKDGGALANLTTTPTVEPAGSCIVKLTLSVAECTADNIVIVGVDMNATKEWADFFLSIPMTQ